MNIWKLSPLQLQPLTSKIMCLTPSSYMSHLPDEFLLYNRSTAGQSYGTLWSLPCQRLGEPKLGESSPPVHPPSYLSKRGLWNRVTRRYSASQVEKKYFSVSPLRSSLLHWADTPRSGFTDSVRFTLCKRFPVTQVEISKWSDGQIKPNPAWACGNGRECTEIKSKN